MADPSQPEQPTTHMVANPAYLDLKALHDDVEAAQDTLAQALKGPADLMHGREAWTGPTAAKAFTEEISGRDQRLPGLVRQILERGRGRDGADAQGGRAPAQPRDVDAVMRPDDGGGSSNYSSIQFSGMQSLISEVRTAGSTLQDTTRGLQSTATGCGVSSPAFAQIIEIGAWAESQVAGLERRLTLAQGAAKAIDPGLTGWTIDEPVDMTAAEAAKKGQALAQRIIDHNSTDSDFIKITDDTLDELELYEGDPDVLSAFYATLGPRETQAMPALLEGSGAQDSTQLEKLSRTFALAFNDPDPPAGFTEVTDVSRPPPATSRPHQLGPARHAAVGSVPARTSSPTS